MADHRVINHNVIFPPGTLLKEPDLPDRVPPPPNPWVWGSRRGQGGCYNHNAACKCRPCEARRREPKTLAVAAGVGGMSLAPVDAPLQALTDQKGRKHAAPRALRDRVAQYLHHASANPNATIKELAESMGITPGRLHKIIKDGQATGILVFEDPLSRIEHELVPKIIDNLKFFLDAKDKAVTIEAAKGTIFRQYQDSKGISDGASTILALKIEQSSGSDVKVMTGHIVGTPKKLPVVTEVE